MPSKIHYTKPSITPLELKYVTDAIENGWGENCYHYIHRFEQLFRKYLGVKHALATSSCTGALHMGLSALGIKAGDEVILGDINWIASAAPITYLDATPIFVDVLPDTWCIDPAAVENAITNKTKAIIAVHLYGNVCAIDELQAIADRYGIPLIEDSAEAIGSEWQGKKAGSIGKFGTFSFHGTKTMTTGEGGMFVTNDDELYEKVLKLSNHGRGQEEEKQFWASDIGFKYKMSNIQAAIGCAQVERIDSLISKKRSIFSYYQKAFSDSPISMNIELENTKNGYWMPTIVVNDDVKFDRKFLLQNFKENKIDGRVFFWPLSMLSMFKEKSGNKVSYNLYSRGVNLPSYHDITQADQDRVIKIVKSSLDS